MENLYVCARCKQKYPSEKMKYTVRGDSFELVCANCLPQKPRPREAR